MGRPPFSKGEIGRSISRRGGEDRHGHDGNTEWMSFAKHKETAMIRHMNERRDRKRQTDIGTRLIWAGLVTLLAGVVAFVLVFGPALREEIRYRLYDPRLMTSRVSLNATDARNEDVLVPVDADYSIVIPKIGANVPVVADVDPLDAQSYRAALSRGIAQATGTKAPGESGNTFLFAHSSEDFLTRGRYNTVFYLLDKLSIGDRFTIAYQGKLYDYRIFDKKTVASDDMRYLHALSKESTVTLMTCWPPGTDIARLLVFGVLDGIR